MAGPEAICDQYCDVPKENFPYSDSTFSMVARLAQLFVRHARANNVPPIAVAGSVADEYNTRAGLKGFFDWVQDEVLLNWLPSWSIDLDHRIGSGSRMLNATKHDVGIGNVNVGTARQMFAANRNKFPPSVRSWAQLVDYLRTDEGTIHIAALVIAKAKQELAGEVASYPPGVQEAVYISYYKEGPRFIARYKARLQADANSGGIRPGDGCRVYLQRQRFAQILGVP
jgi:hypothetical protein